MKFEKLNSIGSISTQEQEIAKNMSELKKAYTKVQRRQFIVNMLNENFPLVPLILSTLLDVVLALGAIALQILQIVYASSLYFIGCG